MIKRERNAKQGCLESLEVFTPLLTPMRGRSLHLFRATFLNKWWNDDFQCQGYWICHFILFTSHLMMCFVAEIRITRYPGIFNFKDGKGWVLEKSLGWVGLRDPINEWYLQFISVYNISGLKSNQLDQKVYNIWKYPFNSKPISSFSFCRKKKAYSLQ